MQGTPSTVRIVARMPHPSETDALASWITEQTGRAAGVDFRTTGLVNGAMFVARHPAAAADIAAAIGAAVGAGHIHASTLPRGYAVTLECWHDADWPVAMRVVLVYREGFDLGEVDA